MKRFYKIAEVQEVEGGFGLTLDGRSVKTPGRANLAVPTRALAEGIAAEWEAQVETIDPRAMPLTGLSNAAIDKIAPAAADFAASLARYGESDLLCYRADTPDALVSRQALAWDPILAWARGRYDIGFEVVAGIMHRAQHEETVARVGRAFAGLSPFALAGLSNIVTISGSAVIALALYEQVLTTDEAFAAATVDEAWQVERWGEDDEASKALAGRRAEFEAAARFLELLRAG